MSQMSVKNFLLQNFVDPDFKITKYYDIKSITKKTMIQFLLNSVEICKKESICLRFNSTLDLSNNSEAPNNQRCLFNEDEWEKIKNDYDAKAKVKFENIPESTMTELKDIENLAEGSLTKAYRECLMNQAEYAFTKEKTYKQMMQITQNKINLIG
ncbi:uncharacterized protein BX663DRAFT_488984 [Cokeromyces recurvatus]|uniref:uncharacterized protein n=1 Tax=Cokeromyces recurvatus TaxID=90255 RepID=UPI00221F810E|nr:uncharacterized protein BX663DRAFT_488984 [Cokeromyces recurvatus]KAI7899762.1 hypothetical protein BX663DRAFT_488984 [Cokeromyces recurvatus]